MQSPFLFLPAPRRVDLLGGAYSLPVSGSLILLDAPQPQQLRLAAARIQSALLRSHKLRYEQVASAGGPREQTPVILRVAPERVPVPQGYRLHVTPAGILIEGKEPAGVFYGACTLVQLLEQLPTQEVPYLEITDWPDIPSRGVMLDISRDRVYTMETLYELIERLAGWKINQVQLYTEHTFAYRNHPMVWEKASPVTGEEIMELDAFCRERFIELVPNQNSFGHMERWLIHPPYADLAETHDWFDTPWKMRKKGPFSLAPEHPGSMALVESLYDELLPHFSSRLFNVGCDETIDVGQGVSKDLVALKGRGRVYLDFLLKIYANVKRRDHTMMFWGDIINNDHPELAAELPRDVIALNWGYEAAHPFSVECERFASSGVPFYVCPGTSTWCSLGGRTDNAIGNLLNAAENGIQYGAIGYLNTDWGDLGHWQVPPVSYLGFVVGAGLSWALQANRDMDVPTILSTFAFEDPTGVMGKVAYNLGNIYKVPSLPVPNGSALFWLLQRSITETGYAKILTPESLQRTVEAIDEAIDPLADARMARPDAAVLFREFSLTARLMRHGALRGLLYVNGKEEALCQSLAKDMAEILPEYRELWLARSRPGGLADSAGRLERAAAEYLE